MDQVEDSEDYFRQLDANVGPIRSKEFAEFERNMQMRRDTDVSAMDEMDVIDENGLPLYLLFDLNGHSRCKPAPGQAEIQMSLAESESDLNFLPGSSAWLAMGLRIEEQQ